MTASNLEMLTHLKTDTEKLSKDRWKIFKIIGEDLVDVSAKSK